MHQCALGSLLTDTEVSRTGVVQVTEPMSGDMEERYSRLKGSEDPVAEVHTSREAGLLALV